MQTPGRLPITLAAMLAVLLMPAHGRSSANAQSIRQRMIWINEETQPAVKALYRADMADAPIAYQADIDPDDNGVLDDQALTAWVNAHVAASWSGPVTLDWEGFAYEAATRAIGEMFDYTWSPENFRSVVAAWKGTGALTRISNTNSSATVKVNRKLFTAVQGEMIRAINIVKTLRPNAQVGMYGMPPRVYWGDRLGQLRALADRVRPILDASSALFPSVYDFYNPQMDPNFAAGDLAYVRDNVQVALEYANGKPVYPYVWPRYHDSVPQWGLCSIPADELRAHVAAVFDAQGRDGSKARGIVYWGCDNYAIVQRGFAQPMSADTVHNYAVRIHEFGNNVSLAALLAGLNALHWHHLRVMDDAANGVSYSGQLPVPVGPVDDSSLPPVTSTTSRR